LKIELGGGTLLTPGYTNLDPVHGVGEWKRYAQDTPWPVGDNSVEAMRASHIMEHIPAGMDHRVKVMNEAHRVLKPGGIFEIVVPLLVGTWHAIADPTHVSFWVKESFHYFDGLFAANAHYGISLWETVDLTVRDGWEGIWVGRKPLT
jgi:SAM-dependent methyltransferase